MPSRLTISIKPIGGAIDKVNEQLRAALPHVTPPEQRGVRIAIGRLRKLKVKVQTFCKAWALKIPASGAPARRRAARPARRKAAAR